ncbi:MAG: polymerase, sigma-24 subunit, subfamily [Phycisphaerales bacterium]|nr:polymerase, sigma-24 subunit, subfamily [Phycisphaerales bacterium]
MPAKGSCLEDAVFRKLIVAEIDAVYRLACHLTHSRQQADDLVQETYLRALRSAGTFTLAEHGVRPWLFKILHNVIFSRGARQKREREVMEDLRQDMPPPETSAPLVQQHLIDWDNVDERLKAAVNELPAAYRVAFLLSSVEGLKYREIADVTEVPVGTVMSRLSRARTALVTSLAGLAAEQRLMRARTPAKTETRET